MTIQVLTGARIFDGAVLQDGKAVVVEGARIIALVDAGALLVGAQVVRLNGGILAPGLVDVQVNGGGGLLFNDSPDMDTLRCMASAHARLGATTILPTLITDTPDRVAAAVGAVRAALDQGVPGIGGLHLEGPHLARSRKGAHDGDLIRPMAAEDLAVLQDAARDLPTLVVTLAPESVTPDQIAALVSAGAVVSLGHSDCSHAQVTAAVAAGASMVTHLFNAMSPLGSREPGLVGGGAGRGCAARGADRGPSPCAWADALAGAACQGRSRSDLFGQRCDGLCRGGVA
ncbi:N-acetylglucosamine 6-phosphate deacetylase [Puniceibacterium sp. IMCC21224]|nr:amidohydrolase family protein [Puniceibacterium sp. IMCC21224]KMK63771.1 N-acetylglucosamine 6-phosphate deacetylase [Puniceibacterium sp. IMCC21224]